MTKEEAIAKYHALQATVTALTDELGDAQTATAHMDAMIEARDALIDGSLCLRTERFVRSAWAKLPTMPIFDVPQIRVRNPFVVTR